MFGPKISPILFKTLPLDLQRLHTDFWRRFPRVKHLDHGGSILFWTSLDKVEWSPHVENYLGYRIDGTGRPEVLVLFTGQELPKWQPVMKMIRLDSDRLCHFLMIFGAIFKDPVWHFVKDFEDQLLYCSPWNFHSIYNYQKKIPLKLPKLPAETYKNLYVLMDYYES